MQTPNQDRNDMKLPFKLFLYGLLALGLPAFGKTVNWTGVGDCAWNNPANWSGSVVPGPADDAVITNGLCTTVTLSGAVTVKSFQCTKAFTISGGSLSVTGGTSLLQGPLCLSPSSWLSASGSNATLTCTGPASMDGAQLFVSGGATLSLTSLRNYGQTHGNSIDWQASDAGRVLDLPGLTNLVGGVSGSYLNLSALAGGTVSATNLVTITNGAVQATATGGSILVPRLAVAQW